MGTIAYRSNISMTFRSCFLSESPSFEAFPCVRNPWAFHFPEKNYMERCAIIPAWPGPKGFWLEMAYGGGGHSLWCIDSRILHSMLVTVGNEGRNFKMVESRVAPKNAFSGCHDRLLRVWLLKLFYQAIYSFFFDFKGGLVSKSICYEPEPFSPLNSVLAPLPSDHSADPWEGHCRPALGRYGRPPSSTENRSFEGAPPPTLRNRNFHLRPWL